MNGETTVVVSGTPSLSTTADSSSTVAGNPYSITVASGTLSAANYSFAFANGVLSVTPASVVNGLTSSANPSPTGSNVTFTATLSSVLPSTGIPTGRVQFKADGSSLGSPAPLSSGAASLTSSSLSHGTHTITAEYAGDGNFFGSTNDLGSGQIIDIRPVALSANYSRLANSSLKIFIPDLITNYTSDADGDPRTVVSVGSGTNGATIFMSGDWICYQPSDTDPNRNAPDQFDYTITDGFAGCLATNHISVLVNQTSAAPARLTGIMVVTNAIKINFTGSPGYTYRLQRALTLLASNTVWVDLGAVTPDSLGKGQFIDAHPSADHAFYRMVWP